MPCLLYKVASYNSRLHMQGETVKMANIKSTNMDFGTSEKIAGSSPVDVQSHLFVSCIGSTQT